MANLAKKMATALVDERDEDVVNVNQSHNCYRFSMLYLL